MLCVSIQCYCIQMSATVKPPAQRTRRAEKAERTRRQILRAAHDLFLAGGYAPTTIESIATEADVAVETVYARFRNKAALLEAILEPAIVGADDGTDIFDRPEIAAIRDAADHGSQIQQLASFSRGILERTHTAHQILASAAPVDANAAALAHRDTRRRLEGQRRYVDMLLERGPLRRGLSYDDAAATYSSLANPTTYSLLVRDLGWTAEKFQGWLEDSLRRLLLDT